MSFNPLVIGSNALIHKQYPKKKDFKKFQSPSNRVKCSDSRAGNCRRSRSHSFNPLAIGSNVLIRRAPDGRNPSQLQFQSPSNRVKCSDFVPRKINTENSNCFNPPSNRVKWSDSGKAVSSHIRPSVFSIP